MTTMSRRQQAAREFAETKAIKEAFTSIRRIHPGFFIDWATYVSALDIALEDALIFYVERQTTKEAIS